MPDFTAGALGFGATGVLGFGGGGGVFVLEGVGEGALGLGAGGGGGGVFVLEGVGAGELGLGSLSRVGVGRGAGLTSGSRGALMTVGSFG